MNPDTLTLVAIAPASTPLLRAATAAAASLLDLPLPVRWTFAVEVGGKKPARAELTVASIDASLTEQAVEAAAAVLAVTMPWTTWTTAHGTEDLQPLPFSMILSEAPPTNQMSPAGPDLLPSFWQGATAATARTRFAVTLLGAADGTTTGTARGQVVLSSESATVLAVGGTLAAGLTDDTTHVAFGPRRSTDVTVPLTTSLIGRCLTTPSLVPAGWDTRPAVPASTLLTELTRSAPPHTAVFGGSGLGKTTLLRAMVQHRLSAGGTVVVLDPHGDLAARTAMDADHLGAPVQMLDFGDPEHPPRWNVTRPPDGVDPRAWVTELLTAIQAAWPGADDQWFGPVFRRAMAGLLLPLVLDPAGPWPLPRVLPMALPKDTGLQDPDAQWRAGVLDRVPADVARDAWEAIGLMDRDRDGHARTWLLSKLEPLLQHPGMRAVLDHPAGTVDLASVQAGTSLIAALPASTLGDEGATVLSLLLMRWLWGHARRVPDARPVDLVLDEAHRMPAAMCQELLAEGRKFGMQLRLGSQSPAGLRDDLRTAVLTNVGAVASFRVGPLDAAYMRSRLGPSAEGDLAGLRPHQVLVSTGSGCTAVGTGPAGESVDTDVLRRLSRSDVLRQQPDLDRAVVEQLRAARTPPVDQLLLSRRSARRPPPVGGRTRPPT